MANTTTIPSTSSLHTLHRATGSATYISALRNRKTSDFRSHASHPTHPLTIISSVNFPLELTRRSDEDPEDIHIDVHIRPASGVGTIRERHVEELVRRTLGVVVMGREYARCVLGVGLQMIDSGEMGEGEGGDKTGYLWMVEGCINAAVLGCLDAGVPMRDVVGAVGVGVLKTPAGSKRRGRDVQLLVRPDTRERKSCASLHVFAFTGDGQLVLAESEGRFDVATWSRAEKLARRAVVGKDRGRQEPKGQVGGEDVGMNGHQDGEEIANEDEEGEDLLEDGSVLGMFRRCVEERVARDERWKGG